VVHAVAPSPPPRSPSALAALLADHDRLVSTGAPTAALAASREAIGKMAAQRDAHVSRLFWYTDLEDAKREAQATGRPILSLHLLGRLDEDLSCANSRLFRLTLYADRKVSDLLRDTYVLHWTSERPAPEITLDYGDGRVVRRTITGNSAHFVLDARGRAVDVLPGLYGPVAFTKALARSLDIAKKSGDMTAEESRAAVAKHHTRETWALTASWRSLLGGAYPEGYDLANASLPKPAGVGYWPHPLYASLPAVAVNQLTENKAGIEAPPLALLQPEIRVYKPWDGWEPVVDRSPAEHLDAASRALVKDKHPRDWSLRDAPLLDAATLDKHLAALERRMTEEELRSEYVFHGAIHARMAKPAHVDLADLDEWVYATLFMTAKTDAWLGLVPTTAITGIEDDGLVPRG
jgi:hypothetical protein